ncbi:MAG: glycoside hydrolase family 15 protein [Actinomycetes bacterium]
MSSVPLEDYAIVGDTSTVALVGRHGGVDWLCLPRFDSSACFAALVGDRENGHWTVAPRGEVRKIERRYRPDSLVLETTMTTDGGRVRVVDCMPLGREGHHLLRRVEGLDGTVDMRSELVARLDYGHVVPWVHRTGDHIALFTGPDTLTLHADVEHDLHGDHRDPVADFSVRAGDTVDLQLGWRRSVEPDPEPVEPGAAIEETDRWWRDWATRSTYSGPDRDAVVRSLITLKALTYAPSGGIIAAPTASLPEQLGGVRNWDYRYCWIRDATFTLLTLLESGYTGEATQWREWLIRALAGTPEQMQMIYGVEGERRLPELELPWLSGYEDSSPVRVGNGAAHQFQLDVYGELMDALHQARAYGIPPESHAWDVQRSLLDFVEEAWRKPDWGIWEIRGEPQHFTYSKVMAWAALDRAVRAVEDFDLPGPVERWLRVRQEIHDEVCAQGFDEDRNTFTQYYGSRGLDAALLLIGEVGFLEPDDPRVIGTVRAVEEELCHDGLVRRYSMDDETRHVDGLPPGEGTFLPCTFWLADAYRAQGRHDDARRLFERLLDLRNDVGLLAEEYDVVAGRLVGNFPQGLSHLALVNTALNLTDRTGPGPRRRRTGGPRSAGSSGANGASDAAGRTTTATSHRQEA